ncbi:MAG: hypothetical protein ACFE0O_10745 [Opitutales bacterium]
MPDPADDPFARHRQAGPVLKCPLQGESVPMTVLAREAKVEQEAAYSRPNGYERIVVRFGG